jgi:GNAT superfamily N-acetyltransferase
MPITISRSTLQDLKGVASLFDQYRIFYGKSSDIDGAVHFLENRMHNNESVIFHAMDDKRDYIGFTQLYPIFSSTRMKKLWLLNDLFIHPQHRGQGVSVQLMETAQEWAIGTHSAGLILETAKDNVIGNLLYPRTGFTLDKEHNYYSWDCP